MSAMAGSALAAPAKAKAPQPAAVKGEIQPKAVDLLKAMSDAIGHAKTLGFDVISTYESPSRYGPPLAYKTMSHVALQRPDKLKVVTTADGPPTEFYYDGKTMMSFAVQENLVAMADAPPTVDQTLEALYKTSGTYFPFADFLVSDPYADMAKSLTLAFYIGQSNVVGGVTTDMVAYESEGVFVQVWIGADDKLPRMARAIFFDDPMRLRHQVEISNWKLDAPMKPEEFTSAKAAGASKIPFEHPSTHQAPAAAHAGSGKPATKPASAAH
jgi:hypothetical protein